MRGGAIAIPDRRSPIARRIVDPSAIADRAIAAFDQAVRIPAL
jgi:hypothetical protein